MLALRRWRAAPRPEGYGIPHLAFRADPYEFGGLPRRRARPLVTTWSYGRFAAHHHPAGDPPGAG